LKKKTNFVQMKLNQQKLVNRKIWSSRSRWAA